MHYDEQNFRSLQFKNKYYHRNLCDSDSEQPKIKNKISDKSKIEMLNDILFLESQIHSLNERMNTENLILEKKKMIIKTQESLKLGVNTFLNKEFKYNKICLLTKTKFIWSKLMFDKLLSDDKILLTRGQNVLLLTPSIFKGIINEVYLVGWHKLLVDLYEYESSFSGFELLNILINYYNNKKENLSNENFTLKVVSFLSLHVIYYNSLLIL